MSGGSPTLAALGRAADQFCAADEALAAAKRKGTIPAERIDLWKAKTDAIEAVWEAVRAYGMRPRRAAE